MNKKLLTALIVSLAAAMPQANAESALETAINSTVEQYIMTGNQSVTANLTPQTGDLAGRLLVINDDETATLANYYNISGNNHSGFNFQEGALALNNVNTVSGFSTNGNGGAFCMTDDAELEWWNFVDKDHLGTITGNTATGNGGGIYSDGHYAGAVQLHGVSVTNNQAGGKGGGIYASYGVHSLFANSGAVLNFTGNTSSLGGDDIYLTNQAWMRIVSRGNGTATATVNVDNLRLDNKSEFYIVTPKTDAGAGIVNIKNIELSNGSTLDFSKDYKHANTTINNLSLNSGSILNTVDGYINNSANGLNIKNINLDTNSNIFKVDANLGASPTIDNFDKVTIASGTGNIKLAVNVTNDVSDSGSLTLIDNVVGNLTIPESTTQYGNTIYKFTQSAPNSGVINYTTVRGAMTLKEAISDLNVSEFDMPEVTVSTTDLGHMAYDTTIGPRTFTIYGKGDSPGHTEPTHEAAILTTDGGEHAGIQLWSSYLADADGSKLVIKDLAAFNGFTSKYTSGTTGHEGYGGAIYANQALLDIDNVAFTNNVSTGDPTITTMRTAGNGGAIYVSTYEDGSQDNYSKFKDSSFINNKAITVGPSNFASGDSTSKGGAIASHGQLDIKGTLFSDNQAITNIKGGTAAGGAIYGTRALSEINEGRDVLIDNSVFMNNIAGGVDNEGDALLSTNGYGGALYAYKIDPTITDSAFIGNIAQAAGDITGEYGPLSPFAEGGAIYFDKERTDGPFTMNISGSNFSMNKAQIVKSAPDSNGNYVLSDNQSNALGGAIAAMTLPAGSGEQLLTVNIDNTSFIGNSAGQGGAIFNYAAEMNIKDSSFKNNIASVEGGAIHNGDGFNSKAVLNLNNVEFSNNVHNTSTTAAKNDISNDGTVNFVGKGSTLDGGITGYYYGTTNFNLDSNEEMDIASGTNIIQRYVNVNSGALNVENANSLDVRSGLSIGENGTLNLGCGVIGTNVENRGTLNIESGGFDFVDNTYSFENYGTVISYGELADDIHGTLKLGGTLNIQDDVAITSITDTEPDPDVPYPGVLDMNDHIVDMQFMDKSASNFTYETTENPTYNTLTVGNLKGAGYLKIDTSFGDATTTSDKIVISDGTINDAQLVLKSVNIKKSADLTENKSNYITFLDTTGDGTLDGISTYLGTLDNDGIATITSGGKQYTFSINTANKGNLDVTVGDTQATFADFIQGNEMDPEVNTYSFDNSVIVDANIGTTSRTGANKELNVYMNGNKLIGVTNASDTPQFDGITVDSDYTLNVNGQDSTAATPTNGTIQGFTTAFTVEEDATLNVDNVTFTGNDVDIANDGQVNFTGDNTLDTIVGDGDTYIIGDNSSVTVTTTLEQGNVYNGGDLHLGTAGEDMLLDASIQNRPSGWGYDGGETIIDGNVIASGDAEIRQYITINEDAALTIDADNIGYGSTNITVGDDAALNLYGDDSTLANGINITGDGATVIMEGASVTNNANIGTQLAIEEDASFSSNANNLNNVQGPIDNDGALEVTGGTGWMASTLNTDIEGDGATTINGNVTSNADIGQNVTVASGTFTNNGDIDGTVINQAGATLNGNGTMNNLYNAEGATASIAADSVSGSSSTIINEGDLTLNGNNNPFSPTPTTFDTKIMGIDGTTTLTGNIDIADGAHISQETVNIGNTNPFSFGGTNVESNGAIVADELNINSSGWGSTTFTNGEDGSVVMDTINISGNGFGTAELVNESSIFADEINLGSNAALTLAYGSTTHADINVASTSTSPFAQDAEVNIESGATISGDVTIDDGDLNLTTGSQIDGDVYAEGDDVNINLIADGASILLDDSEYSVITGDIMGIESDEGSYVINTTSDEDNGVMIDKNIAGATAINGDGNLVLTDTTTTSINQNDDPDDNAVITMAEGSELVLLNTGDDDTTAVINNNITGDGYDVNFITENESTTELTSTISGADNVNVNTWYLNVKTGDATSSSEIFGDAKININTEEDADDSEIIFTAAADTETFAIDNDITGDEEKDNYVTLVSTNTGNPDDPSDNGTQFTLDGNIENAYIDVASGELYLTNEQNLSDVEIAIEDGATLNTMDGTTSSFATEIDLEDGALVQVDVNAVSGQTDSFNVDYQGDTTLTDVDLQDLDKVVQHTTKVDLSEQTGIDNLTIGDALLDKTFTAMTPIRKMEASFDENGIMTIAPSSGNNNWKDYNPAILAAPIAAQFGGYLTQLNAYNQAFSNMDMYMLMNRKDRQALKFRNQIASIQGGIAFDPTNSPNSSAAAWFRPFVSYEKTSLHHGPEVESTAYGSYFGGDSSMKDLGHGWDGMWGAYVGYNGSHQSYTDTSIYQNGGTLGLVGMAFKDNFFVGGTVNVGASAGEASTKFGSEEFAMLMSGAALRGGYNWELADGKFIIQPSLQTSYTFVNTFDYTNAAGVRINSNPLHAITVEPGVKFIGNLKNGWQPYAGISLVYTIMDRADVKANDIALPNIAINPYVKYGLGVRKTMGDRLSGFIQTFFMSGGRNGIGAQMGLRWAIGKDGSNQIKGKTPELKETQITLNNKK